MKRRNLLAAAAAGSFGAVLAASGAHAAVATAGAKEGATAAANPVVPSPLVPAAEADQTVEPQGGAGLFDVDPDQGNVSQSPDVIVTGDVAALSEDWGF